jgi:hypothetical protein
MLVDFLKGNHLAKKIATMLWLWEMRGLESHKSDWYGHQPRYRCLAYEWHNGPNSCGSRPLGRPGRWCRHRDSQTETGESRSQWQVGRRRCARALPRL